MGVPTLTPAPEEPAEKAYLSGKDAVIGQILETVEATEQNPKTLIIAPDPEENLLETDEMCVTLTADDLKELADDGYGAVTVKSICDQIEMTATVENLQSVLNELAAEYLTILITDIADLPEGTEIVLPEGMTAASGTSRVVAKAYVNGELVDVDPALLTGVKFRMMGTAPLSDVNNDIVGLFIDEQKIITELDAEYIFNETTNTGYWEIPYAGNGLYLTAEKAAE